MLDYVSILQMCTSKEVVGLSGNVYIFYIAYQRQNIAYDLSSHATELRISTPLY